MLKRTNVLMTAALGLITVASQPAHAGVTLAASLFGVHILEGATLGTAVDVTVSGPDISTGTHKYWLKLDANAYFTYKNTTTNTTVTGNLDGLKGLYEAFDFNASNPTSSTGAPNNKWNQSAPNATPLSKMFGYSTKNNLTQGDRVEPGQSKGTFSFTGTTVPTGKHVYWGLDVSTSNNVLPGDDGKPTSQTGWIYFKPDGVLPPTSVPEPAFYQMSSLLTLGGIGVLRLRKGRRSS